jgi:nucleoside-diphosphate-sugar epimerase
LPTLITASQGDEPIEFTAGLHKRDFTFVDDVGEGLLRLGLTRGPAGEVINLATGRLTTVRRFVETAAAALGIETNRLAFGELPTRKEEMEHDPVSIKRLIERTGWRPSTTIEEGLRQTFEFESSFDQVGTVLEIV